jgi:hypothetical protein
VYVYCGGRHLIPTNLLQEEQRRRAHLRATAFCPSVVVAMVIMVVIVAVTTVVLFLGSLLRGPGPLRTAIATITIRATSLTLRIALVKRFGLMVYSAFLAGFSPQIFIVYNTFVPSQRRTRTKLKRVRRCRLWLGRSRYGSTRIAKFSILHGMQHNKNPKGAKLIYHQML